MKETGYYVYMHKNKINNKVYIGITSQNPRQRWRNGTNYWYNTHFYRAIKKYGWNEGFEHLILFSGLTKKEAENKEIELIKQYDSTNKNKGYNIEYGGNATGKHSKDTLIKMSESQKGELNHMYGKKGALNSQSKKIIRLNDRKIFDSQSEVKTFAKNISSACNNKILYSGCFDNGEEMLWMNYEDYSKLSEYEILRIIKDKKDKIYNWKSRKSKKKKEEDKLTKYVMSLNRTMVLKTLNEACQYYGIGVSQLCSHLKGDINVCYAKNFNEYTIFKEIDYYTYLNEIKYNVSKENIHIHFNKGTCIEIFKDGVSFGVCPSINYLSNISEKLLNKKLEVGGIRYQINKSKKDYKGYTFKKITKEEYLQRIGTI